ncbi:MAG: chemotaxis protein CheD [Myxococcaceae bacterium]|nr:chemotaxis protein CheD [Myxococcaceae bacterium]
MGDELDVTLYIGGRYAEAEPATVRTTLGSCIAVCLYDPARRVGGMNHFMLPEATGSVSDPGRYGGYAMELLIGDLQKCGALRSRMVAKVFGGGHVLGTAEREDSVPNRNIAFTREYLRDEGFRVVSTDVGGLLPRLVKFETWSGRAFVRRLARPVATLRAEEQLHQSSRRAVATTSLDFF